MPKIVNKTNAASLNNLRQFNINAQAQQDDDAMDFEPSQSQTSDPNFDSSYISVDFELISEIIEFILDGNCCIRTISMLVFSILRLVFI